MKRGFGLIEIVIGSAILGVALWAIAGYYQQSVQVSRYTAHTVQAGFLLEESLEVTKFFRDTSWTNISASATGTPMYLIFNGTKWATSTTNLYVDGTFERKIQIDNVYRNGTDDITSVPGTFDPGTRKVTATVSWLEGSATSSRTLATYLSNIF
jgi:prepilin-type N-terminal cleavage/methylation domain-containing protein